ncbi:hypothetical protein IAU59_003995 [Kwoniella sp. CBS 9459]
MTVAAHQHLFQRILGIQPAFSEALKTSVQDHSGLNSAVVAWERVAQDLMNRRQANDLDQKTASAAWTTAHNLKRLASEAMKLQDSHARSIEQLTETVSRIAIHSGALGKRPPPSTPLRSSKRARHPSFSTPSTPPTRCLSPTPSLQDDLATASPDNNTSKNPPKDKSQEPDHSLVRLWFLDNISFPYPTISMKEDLASSAGITRAKVDSDLTNFRRRAGWTEIMNEYCGGDRQKMRKLIERVEGGEERDEDLVRRVEGVKEYLTRKEEERVGDWVREVTALVPSFKLDAGSTSSPSTASTTAKLLKHRSSASLSSLSAMSSVSAVIRPASRSTSTSSTTSMESSSSVSDASMVIPGTKGNKKRLNPDAAVFVPKKRVTLPSATEDSPTEPSAFEEAFASTAHSNSSSAHASTSASVLAPSLTFTTISGDHSATHSRSASGGSSTGWQYQPTWTTDATPSSACSYTFVHPGIPAPLPTPLLQPRSSPPQSGLATHDQSIWSTDTPLPMLSHMSSSTSSSSASSMITPMSPASVQQHASWMIPSQCGFEPRLQDGWAGNSSGFGSTFDGGRSVSGASGRSVSDVSRGV